MNKTSTATILCIVILVIILGVGGFLAFKFKDELFDKKTSDLIGGGIKNKVNEKIETAI